MMRSHGTDTWREIYYYGKKGEPVYDALVAAVKLRYRLLPYIYSQAWQVSRHNDSFMRALFMDFKMTRRPGTITASSCLGTACWFAPW